MAETELFLVRVWRRDDGARAAVQRVGAETAGVFSDALPLGRFLLQAAEPPAPSVEAAGDTEEA